MRTIICENSEEMSTQAAKLVAAQICLKPDSVLGLATGGTPVGMYKELVRLYEEGQLDFSRVVTFNLDEYYPISAKNPNSYHYYMQENLFGKVNLAPKNCHVLDGETQNPKQECESFDALIEESGGIDLQILGIGRNGHIGFNEPDSALNTLTHVTDLTESTLKANARFFDGGKQPRQALTMGIASILKAKKIVLMASGAEKAEPVRQLLTKEIATRVPATMLKVHHDVVLICDRAAYGEN